MILTDFEWALCVAALDAAAKELNDGAAAAIRLNISAPDLLRKTADEMTALKNKILSPGE